MKVQLSCLALLCHLITVIYALYEDQAGKWDWRMQWVGRVLNIQSNSRLLLVASELNVVAAINAASGAILWRHVLDVSTLHMASRLLLDNGALVYVSHDSVRAWTVNKGILKFQTTLPVTSDSSVVGISKPGSELFVVIMNANNFHKYVLDPSDGSILSNQKSGRIQWIKDIKTCQLVSHQMLCIVKGSLYTITLSDISAEPKLIDNIASGLDIKLISTQNFVSPYFLIEHDTNTSLYKSMDNALELVKSFDKKINAASHQVIQDNEYLVYVVENKGHYLKLSDISLVPEWQFEIVGSSKVEKILPMGKSEIAVVYEDACLSVVKRSDNSLIWKREESLAYVVGAEMFDLPLSEGQAQIEEEFSENGDGGILWMLKRRLKMQALQVQRLVLQSVDEVMGMPALISEDWKRSIGLLKSHNGNNEIHRDLFNLRKMIVMSTSLAKVFGIDSRDGSIIWSVQLPFTPLHQSNKAHLHPYLLRSTAHYPHPSIVAFVGRNPESGNGVLVTVDPMVGEVVQVEHIEFPVKHVVRLDTTNQEALKGLALIGQNEKEVLVFPKDMQLTTPVYLLDVRDNTNLIRGYSISNDKRSGQVWQSSISAGANSKLISVTSKKYSERTHSQGRVLGDRNVLYKYSNPHLVAIVTSSEDIKEGGHQLHVDLVDSLTGFSIFSAVHARASEPVSLVHCENWLVYTYWNEKGRRTEISVLELYEGRQQASPHSFSSLVPTLQAPMVMRQAYIFPQGVTSMGVTDTEMGMSNRHLLLAMPFGGILKLPKAILDPRRLLMAATPEQREEGMIPYIPELRIATDHIINYNQTVLRIKNIHASPTGLESTSLILAYGLDIYLSRLTPSGTFDVLKDDFDHWIISSVLAALLFASIVTKRLARQRDLKQAWR